MAAKNRGGAILASALVIFITASFVAFSTTMRRGPADYSQRLHARFVSANGLGVGAAVVLAGVRVGTVSRIYLDQQTQMAMVDFSIDHRLRLPADTKLAILSSGMTSANTLNIQPGTDHTSLSFDSVITNTEAPAALEQQVSNYIFGTSIE